MTRKKSSDFTKQGIESLAKDKPIIYKINAEKGAIGLKGGRLSFSEPQNAC